MEEQINKDETLETNEEEPTSEKEEVTEDIDWKAKSNAMYGKYKNTVKEVDALKAKLAKQVEANENTSEFSAEQVAQTIEAFDGLDANARTKLAKEAKSSGISLVEARKHEDYGLWLSAYRAKKEKDNAPEPSTKQGISETEKPWGHMNIGEKEKWVRGLKVNGKPFDMLPKQWGPPGTLKRDL